MVFVGIVLQYNSLLGQPLEEAIPPPRRFRVTRAASEIQVDAVLDEPAWSHAVAIDLPFEWFPGDNVRPPVETECRVTYDTDNLYLGCRAFDPAPKQIRARLADRDGVTSEDDHLGFLLDTFNDQRRAFQFRVNPLGVQMDAILSTSEGEEDSSWDAIWNSAGRITAEGYVVELAIPFRSLRFAISQEARTWGFIAVRSYPRRDRHEIGSSYNDRDNTCRLCQANNLYGLEGISPGRNLEFVPTVTASRTEAREDFPWGDMVSDGLEAETGLTAQWGLTPSLILNAAVNPDFSQVEADAAQLEVNERFALFFPEKRPFFLEGADFYATSIQAVFTRTVADPLAGLKLTGKQGKNAVGAIATLDRINNLTLPSNQMSIPTSLDQDVAAAVLRYRRDAGRASTFGVLYTGREAEGYHNHVFGLDGYWQISRSNEVSFHYLRTYTKYPTDFATIWGQKTGSFVGNGFTINAWHESRNWMGGVSYEDFDPDFRADAGFVPRVDIREIDGFLARKFWGRPEGWFTFIGVGAWVNRKQDHDGRLTEQSIGLVTGYEGPLQSELNVQFGVFKEHFDGVIYDLNRAEVTFKIRPSAQLSVSFTAALGDEIDFANSRKADNLRLIPGVQLRIGRRLRIGLNHNLQRLSLRGEKIFAENLFQTGLSYHLNVRSFVRVVLQYRDVSRNPDLYSAPVVPEEDHLFTQFLFSYKLNPQTVLFLGYSDNRLGLHEIALTHTDRTFFFKVGYALRL
ncbi:MAG: carbohydrate binding family 9 domain-containing protein [Gemmatimonadota bacterium]|nr:MAG: carbohydrate binding family 9 domain-containing protein [Gemmatimonadota bacterium]